MSRSISSGLKTTFLVHCLVALVLGLVYLLVPTQFGEAVGWPASQPFDHRVIGTVFLAFGVASALAYRQPLWESVKVLVEMQMAWTVLASALILWGLVAGDLPVLGWAYLALVGGFAVLFFSFHRGHNRQLA